MDGINPKSKPPYPRKAPTESMAMWITGASLLLS